MTPLLQQFCDVYQELDATNLDLLDSIYADNIIFEDPFHRIEGRESLKRYFQRLYRNLAFCKFGFSDPIATDSHAFIRWQLTFAKQQKQRVTMVNGCTALNITDNGQQIHYHRDFFDAGEMIYEQIPIMGSIIRQIKKRL